MFLFTIAQQDQSPMQVKVWLGDNQDHYYVLSRFLISRMLTVTKVPMNKVRAYFSHLASATHKCPSLFSTNAAGLHLASLRGSSAEQAIKISLEVKKYLVDNEHLDISQVPLKPNCSCSALVS